MASSRIEAQSALCPAALRPHIRLMLALRGRLWVLGTLEESQPGAADHQGWSVAGCEAMSRSELSELATYIELLASQTKEG